MPESGSQGPGRGVINYAVLASTKPVRGRLTGAWRDMECYRVHDGAGSNPNCRPGRCRGATRMREPGTGAKIAELALPSEDAAGGDIAAQSPEKGTKERDLGGTAP